MAPAAVLAELWRRRHLVYVMTAANLKQVHGRTLLGGLWWLLDPLMMTAVYTVVIGFIRGGGNWDDPYPAFLLTSLLCWKAFSQSVLQSINSLARWEGLVNSFAFPPEVLPLSVVFSVQVQALVALPALVPVVLLYSGRTVPGLGPVGTGPFVLALPLVFAVQLLVSTGLALGLSCAGAFFKDLENLAVHAFQAWFFLSPCLYHLGDVIPSYSGLASVSAGIGPGRLLYLANPMAHVMEAFRLVILFGRAPDWLGLAYAALWGLFLIFVGLYAFGRNRRRIAKVL